MFLTPFFSPKVLCHYVTDQPLTLLPVVTRGRLIIHLHVSDPDPYPDPYLVPFSAPKNDAVKLRPEMLQ